VLINVEGSLTLNNCEVKNAATIIKMASDDATARLTSTNINPNTNGTGIDLDAGSVTMSGSMNINNGKAVDMEKGSFTPKDQVEITNSSYVTISKSKKYLYSITDFGVEAYAIMEDGNLDLLNFAPINGMRGCYLSTDYKDEYLFVAGYHDGKLTVLRLKEDGSIGEITDEIFHKGLGSIAERNFRPHINCARMTHDNRYLLVADQGMDHVNVYDFDAKRGKVKLVDIIRSEMESAPRHVKISQDGRFIYILHELKCYIDVYTYENNDDDPCFEKIQSIMLVEPTKGTNNCASAFSFSADYNYLLSSIAGQNSVIVFNVDKETGLLTKNFCLPVSGEYPKDADIFPNNKYIVSLNHESNEMTFFRADFEAGTMVMNGPAISVEVPNRILFHKLSTN